MTDALLASDEALHFQPECWRVALGSIADAVITADIEGRVTFLNSVATSLTGWALAEAAGQPLNSVFHIVNEEGHQPVESPTVRALRDGMVVGLANHSVLIAKDGTERPIDDSAAPIATTRGRSPGSYWCSETSATRRQEQKVQDALNYADNIIATLRVPFVVLDNNLRVRTANAALIGTFTPRKKKRRVASSTIWATASGIFPNCGRCCPKSSPTAIPFEDFEVEHAFPTLGRRNMLLNARRFPPETNDPEMVLLAIEDVDDPQTGGSRLGALRSPVSSAVPDGQGWHLDPRRRHRKSDRREPVHVGLTGLPAR